MSSSRSMSKRSLVKSPPVAVGCWVLHRESMPVSSRSSLELAGPIGVIAVDRRTSRPVVVSSSSLASSVVVIREVDDELGGDAGVAGIARGDDGGGDDLGVGVDRRHGPCSRRSPGPRSCGHGGRRGRRSRSPGPWPLCGRCGRCRRRPSRGPGRPRWRAARRPRPRGVELAVRRGAARQA